MNPQLIDNVFSDTKAEFKVSLHNTNYTFWKIAKPITNITFISKLYHAYLVMIGKAHAFQFFQDLSLKEQKKWVSDDIKKRVAEYVNEKKDLSEM
jgi:hypothetical protein